VLCHSALCTLDLENPLITIEIVFEIFSIVLLLHNESLHKECILHIQIILGLFSFKKYEINFSKFKFYKINKLYYILWNAHSIQSLVGFFSNFFVKAIS